MSDILWTTQQKLAIETVGDDVLLTASAGAGKTAVLAARCVYLLTDTQRPCDIDQLLVLTFTNAAAAEMRSRIGYRLNEYARANPSNISLRRQLALLDKAHISTVHAFCGSVLREYFYRLSLDPTFETIDADEARLLRLQIATEVFEEHYGSIEHSDMVNRFSQFVQSYSSGVDDRSLISVLMKLNTFTEALHNHDLWLRSCPRNIDTIKGVDPQSLELVQQQKKMILFRLDKAIACANKALTSIEYYDHLRFYTDYICQGLLKPLQNIRATFLAGDFAKAIDAIRELKRFPSAPNRPKGFSDDDISPVKSFIDQAKDEFKDTRIRYGLEPNLVAKQIAYNSSSVDVLLGLHEIFLQRYQLAKQRSNVLDFADLEHLCLRLLREPANTNTDTDINIDRQWQLSDVAIQLRNQFEYILVDEYQDISPIQESIIQSISRSQSTSNADNTDNRDSLAVPNLFMVGDVKQSIYGFRQADPDIFLDKYDCFEPISDTTEENAVGKRIDLNENFRTRREIINSVNYIFSRCMTTEFGRVNYAKDARLVYGATYYDQAVNENATSALELHLLERDISKADPASDPGMELYDADRREAMLIAQRIQQMVGQNTTNKEPQLQVLDKDTKRLRPVQYRDIVVLLRTVKIRAGIWSEIFGQLNIPAHTELSTGYFAATEIRDMINLLTVLDNPQQDIPIAAVLRGPIARLTESQLTAIRLSHPQIPYHLAVAAYADNGPDSDLQKKLASFLHQLDQWRTDARRGPLAELIWDIYRKTNLLAYVSSLPAGRQRYRNLLNLHDRARQFDSFTRQGLARFLRFIDKLRDEDQDLGPPPGLNETDNVVRIKSIHKSKGLEFPVVIVADLARKFNTKKIADSILFGQSDSCPIGMRVVNSISKDHWQSLAHNLIADTHKQRDLAEEMRILYVALTRAKEKLILVASVELDKLRNKMLPWQHDRKRLPEFLLSSATTPIDWIGPALAAHPDLQAFMQQQSQNATTNKIENTTTTSTAQSHFAVTSYDETEIIELIGSLGFMSQRSKTPKDITELLPDKPQQEDIAKANEIITMLQWAYPHRGLTAAEARKSVTGIKRQLEIESERGFLPQAHSSLSPKNYTDTPPAKKQDVAISKPFEKRPLFLSEKSQQVSYVEKGSWTHLFLELLDLTLALDVPGLTKQAQQLQNKGLLTARQANNIDFKAIATFFTDELGKKLLAHRDHLQREWAFTLAVPAQQVYHDLDLPDTDADEPILVRGIIDCLFQTSQGIVIIDYKTDNITPQQCPERGRSYLAQMLLYRQAVQEILNQKVNEVLLYFLTPGRPYRISATHS